VAAASDATAIAEEIARALADRLETSPSNMVPI
jgi:hypothetical protein